MKSPTLKLLALTFTIFSFMTSTASAGKVYLKFSDGIVGTSTVPGHEGSILIEGAEFSVLQPTLSMGARAILDHTGAVGQAGGRSSSARSQLSEISLWKYTDGTSSQFFIMACLGTRMNSATLSFVSTGSSTPFMKIELTNVFISKYYPYLGDEPQNGGEQIALSYTAIKLTSSVGGVTNSAGFDLMKDKKMP